MKLICENGDIEDYLLETDELNYSHPRIQEKIHTLFHKDQTEAAKVKAAFEFVRDEISHSWDIQGSRVTCTASDVLMYKEGICYAKSNLLAALLRSQHIPTGFCYQRLMLFDTPERGYCIHALNAVYLKTIHRWIRIDARGNKEGIDAQFSIDEESLAFSIQENLGEKDYPTIYSRPHPKTLDVLEKHTNAIEMYKNYLPESLE